MGGLGSLFPRSVAQLTGVIVAGIVGFGTDSDLFVAIPLGVFAGALATLFVTLSEGPRKPAPPRRRKIQRPPPSYREPQPYRESQTWREPQTVREPRREFGPKFGKKKPSPRRAGWR